MPTTLLPYLPESFPLLCWIIQSDGTTAPEIEPQTGAKNAGEALELMPDGTGFRAIGLPAFHADAPLNATQLTDLTEGRDLINERSIWPSLWARLDSDAALDDLTSYTQLRRYSRAEMPPVPASERVEVVVLVSPESQPTTLPALQKRS